MSRDTALNLPEDLKTRALENARQATPVEALAPLRREALTALEGAAFPGRKTEACSGGRPICAFCLPLGP